MSRRSRRPGPVNATPSLRVIHGVTEVTSVAAGVEGTHDVALGATVNTGRSVILIQAAGFTRKHVSTHTVAALTDVAWVDGSSFRLKHWGMYTAGLLFDVPYAVIEYSSATRVVRLLQDFTDSTGSQHSTSISLAGLGLDLARTTAYVLPLSQAANATWFHTHDIEYYAVCRGKRFEGAKVNPATENLDVYMAGTVAGVGRLLAWLVQQ